MSATLKDMALCDEQPSQKGKKTGNRLVQHYTSNPLTAYTGKLDTPIVMFNYILRQGQHIVILYIQNILVLGDVDFLTTVSTYFQSILDRKQTELSSAMVSVEESVMSTDSREGGGAVGGASSKPLSLPFLKVDASVKNVYVAIVEEAEEPQALALKVSTAYFHVQLTKDSKQASVNIADLSIAASNFFNLEHVYRWILLPCSIQFTLTGPIAAPAMDVNGTVEPITLTLTPSIIRLLIHVVTSLKPKKTHQRQLPPSDLWDKKKVEDSNFWFLQTVPLHKPHTQESTATTKKGEMLSIGVESVEVILESEGTQRSRGFPVMAFNVNAVAQVFEWTGDLSVKADIHCEASYYNEQLSVWEPLLEPLESKTGRLSPWLLTLEMQKSTADQLVVSGDSSGLPDPQLTVSVSAESPMQLTLTKTSLELMKALAKAYTKEYERKVETNTDVQTLVGAPFTIVNKLGGSVGVYVQPGPSVKLREKAGFAKLSTDGLVHVWFKKEFGQKSYASLITRPGEEEHTINLAVGSFKKLENVLISTPGSYYYILEQKEPSPVSKRFGLVIEVAVTGAKKTIKIRSPIQFHNHLLMDIELHSALPLSRDKKTCTTVIPSDNTYAVPVEMANAYEFYVVPAGFSLEPMGPPIAWFDKPGGRYADSRCRLAGDEYPCHFIRVLYEEENYVIKKGLPEDDYAHHVFHLHPPLVLQNMLPYSIAVKDDCTMRMIESGQFVHFHEFTQDLEPYITISLTQPGENSFIGKLKLAKKPKQYTTFAATDKGNRAVDVSVFTDDFGYHKLSVFTPFWMINKTGLNIDYLVDGKAIIHSSMKNLVLLSTRNPENKIQLRAMTPRGSQTDWTLKFSLNAVGTSGNFVARQGQHCYTFGVAVHLAQFTLTKIVTITPYHVLVNETEVFLQVAEVATPSEQTSLPPGELVPFWPLTDSNRMLVSMETDKKQMAFNYKSPDTICLRFNNELKVMCVDIHESESATIATFTPYYPGCVPVQVVNHFPDIPLHFWQDTKSLHPLVHRLDPGETVLYTWDNPLGRRVLRWSLVGARVKVAKPIYVTKDAQQTLHVQPGGLAAQTASSVSSSLLSPSVTVTTFPPADAQESWLEVESMTAEEEEDVDMSSETSSLSSYCPQGSYNTHEGTDGRSCRNTTPFRAYWKSFISGIQRIVLFTPFTATIDRVKAAASYSQPQFEFSLSLRAVGISLVDNRNKREMAYIAVTQSGVIWQVEKGRKKWKTLNHSLIAILEEAYRKQEMDVKLRNLVVNLASMEMYSPIRGKLKRTHHEGIHAKFSVSERDYSLYAKVGYVQVDNQLPFSVYPQVLYPLPPPPTVASDTEPKPFVEASIILRRTDEQSYVQHFKYVHVLVQKMAVNADLGFLLAVMDFFTSEDPDPQLEAEYVRSDIAESKKTIKETIVPAISKDLESAKAFFDVLHISPIKIVLSFTVRSVGKNRGGEESVGDRVLQLFLHSLGAILTSVQDTEMKFSLFHLEYRMKTGRALIRTLVKHYRTQALVELYTVVLGLDVLGNPVSIVRGVVGGTIDLFYEPFKGSVLGPDEFFEGLGIGLRSFFGGTVGGITGAGAKITGAVGDVFAKLSFDEQFIDKRQQQKTRPPRIGSKLGGFAKNVFQGVTGVVTQPVKGAKKEGVAGLLKGTGKGLVGLLVRPTGGIIDLASGTLDLVTRKTQVGNVEIQDIRPPRFIGRDGVVRPYSPNKAVGTALLHAVDEGKYLDQFYFGHIQLNKKLIVLVLDRSMMLIEKKLMVEGWHSQGCVRYKHFSSPVTVQDTNVLLHYKPGEEKSLTNFSVRSQELAREVASVINNSYKIYKKEF